MTDWADFPSQSIDTATSLYRIHQHHLHPAWFNTDGSWRFDPLPSHRDRFGVCYLGLEPLAAYVEVFGRIRAVPHGEVDRRRLSEVTVTRRVDVADLTDRTVLGILASPPPTPPARTIHWHRHLRLSCSMPASTGSSIESVMIRR